MPQASGTTVPAPTVIPGTDTHSGPGVHPVAPSPPLKSPLPMLLFWFLLPLLVILLLTAIDLPSLLGRLF